MNRENRLLPRKRCCEHQPSHWQRRNQQRTATRREREDYARTRDRRCASILYSACIAESWLPINPLPECLRRQGWAKQAGEMRATCGPLPDTPGSMAASQSRLKMFGHIMANAFVRGRQRASREGRASLRRVDVLDRKTQQRTRCTCARLPWSCRLGEPHC